MTPTTTTEVKWLTKDEAAARVGCSPRRILEFAQAGLLRSAKQRDGDSRQMAIRLHAGDVERLVDERSREESEVRALPPQALTAPPRRALEAPQIRPWLTLDQAAEYSGLSRELLLALVLSGDLPALRDRVLRDRWRVCREELDALRGVRQATRITGV